MSSKIKKDYLFNFEVNALSTSHNLATMVSVLAPYLVSIPDWPLDDKVKPVSKSQEYLSVLNEVESWFEASRVNVGIFCVLPPLWTNRFTAFASSPWKT